MAEQQRNLTALSETRARRLGAALMRRRADLGLVDVRIEPAPACDSWQVVIVLADGYESRASTIADVDLV